ncbi:ImuA family protein [Pelagibacterium limicola]|uniref:ImuA family protein n=1 Tax=Pelagibacterium limicola TaxID=2791022 RepID=UPI0018AF59A2|nr:hypothetical protein [Pelagibacterium limicola]
MDRAHDALGRLRAIASMSAPLMASETVSLGGQLSGLPALSRSTVHEFFALRKEDAPATTGFVAGVVSRAGRESRLSLWVRCAPLRAGALYGAGLAGMGINPATLIHLPVDNEKDALRAALEGLRCKGLASVVIDIAGPAPHLDLTATRRLKLAAAEHGVTTLILRAGTDPSPSAAQTRWQVAPSLSASPGLSLPGNPAFAVTLLKHPSEGTGRSWEMEWDHETRAFAPKTLSRPVASLPFDRTHREAGESLRARA